MTQFDGLFFFVLYLVCFIDLLELLGLFSFFIFIQKYQNVIYAKSLRMKQSNFRSEKYFLWISACDLWQTLYNKYIDHRIHE